MKITVVDAICGAGKAQPMYSKVLTKNGFKEMREIKVGDEVFGDDGKLHNVVGVFPQGRKKVYEVVFQDGSSTRCCDEHLWTYQLPQDRQKGKYRTSSLREMMDKGIYKDFKNRRVPQYYIPMVKPIDFEKKECIIDPWLLGTLLGDGSFKNTSPTFSNTEEDIINRVGIILKSMNMKLSYRGGCEYAIVSSESGFNRNKINKIMAELELLNKSSHEKFIPQVYKYNSSEVRLEVLRGLIDTDGHVEGNGNIEFSSSSYDLANDVKFLVESLGGTARIVPRIPNYIYKNEKKDGLTNYRIYIKQPKDLLFFSSNKHRSKITIKRQRDVYRQIREVKYIGEEVCKCIKVDNQTELYVTDNFIVTHNTSWAIQYMKEPFAGRFIYVTPYLTEIKRVIESTNGDFKQPTNNNEYGSKIEDLRSLVSRAENIVCTHELFKLCDNDLLELIKEMGYTLILDEVLNVINPIKITPSDLKILIQTGTIEVEEGTGYIKWKEEDYQGKFEELKHLSKNDNLFLFNNTFIFWTLHHKAFEVFEEIFILTYLFDGQIQRYYYDLHGFKYNKKSVIKNKDVYELTEYDPKLDNREKIESRLNIYEDKGKSKLNTNYCKKPTYTMFSSTWLKRCDKETLDRIGGNIRTYFTSLRVNSNTSFWTTIKETAPKLKSNKALYYNTSKRDNFVSINIRATNDYKDCTACAYVFNRFMNPVEKAFFEFHGVKIDEDTLAVSDLIQFIFRGVIRKDQEDTILNVYIPSLRMRELLYRFLRYEI